MIAQLILTVLLAGIVLYAGHQCRRSPVIAALSSLAAVAATYLVWMPTHASDVAQWTGIGRGVDLIIYLWVVISLLVALNLHLKMRIQLELITALTRKIAIANALSAPKLNTKSRRRESALGFDCDGAHSARRHPSTRDQEQSAQDDADTDEKPRRQRLREHDGA
jgi:hypothetical protein